MDQIIGASVLLGDMLSSVVHKLTNLGLPIYIEPLTGDCQGGGATLVCIPRRAETWRMFREVMLREVTSRDLLRIYDAGPECGDRYTAVYFNEPIGESRVAGRGMSASPFHPMGYGECLEIVVRDTVYDALGSLIRFDDLPDACQQCVLQDLVTSKVYPRYTSFVTSGI